MTGFIVRKCPQEDIDKVVVFKWFNFSPAAFFCNSSKGVSISAESGAGGLDLFRGLCCNTLWEISLFFVWFGSIKYMWFYLCALHNEDCILSENKVIKGDAVCGSSALASGEVMKRSPIWVTYSWILKVIRCWITEQKCVILWDMIFHSFHSGYKSQTKPR